MTTIRISSLLLLSLMVGGSCCLPVGPRATDNDSDGDGDADVDADADGDIDIDTDDPDVWVDDDDDGYSSSAVGGDDCDDSDPTVHPGASDIAYDGIDQDCSGSDNADVDHDGHDAASAGGGDCDDGDATIHPGMPEACDGIDQDCDGDADEGACWEPVYWWVDGNFGYDADSGEIISYFVDGQEIPPMVVVHLAEDAYTTSWDEADTCWVVLEPAWPGAPASLPDAGQWLAMDGGGVYSSALSNCSDREFAPSLWGSDPQQVIASAGLGIAVGPLEMGTDLQAAVEGASLDWTNDWQPYVVGGGLHADAFDDDPDAPGGFFASGWAFAYEVDADYEVIDTPDGLKLPSETMAVGAMPTGAYMVSSYWLLASPESLAE